MFLLEGYFVISLIKVREMKFPLLMAMKEMYTVMHSFIVPTLLRLH